MTPKNLNIRQTIEGMPLTFDGEAAGGLTAVIQFHIADTAKTYHLSIANGACQFHVGAATAPTLTIDTPADVWLKVSSGELAGQDALMSGQYQANGDISLLLKMNSLFKSADDVSYDAPADQRPAGPIPLPGMAWLGVAFTPWIFYWVTSGIPPVETAVSVGIPLLLSILIVGYRKIYDKPTVMEWGGLAFFTLAAGLSLMGETGFTIWGSVISSLVMALLWLGTVMFSDMPLSAEYSKWGFVKGLWGNSMFLYPNTIISLMWGWQFIAASILGIIAILLPEQEVIFTVFRYLLLIPAFIYTAVIQKRVMGLRVDDYDAAMKQRQFWAGMGISAISGLILTATMPGFDTPLLGWIALVPLLMVLTIAPAKQRFFLAMPFGLAWSIGVHNWYPNIFPPALGYFLIFAVSTFYDGVMTWGLWLQDRLSGWMKLLALPVMWTAVEYVRFITPMTETWWFVLLAKSQWRFPPALQILSVGGFPALTFIVMLVNVAIAFLLLGYVGRSQAFSEKPDFLKPTIALAIVALILIWGAISIPAVPDNTFTIAALTDMMTQEPDIPGLIKSSEIDERLNNPQRSQDIFEINESLTQQVIAAGVKPDFIVWPENKIASTDNEEFMSQISALAQDVDAYIVVNPDKVLGEGQFQNISLMVAPDGEEVGQRAKIRLFGDASDHGFQIGSRDFDVFDTPYGKVGLGICYDYHFLDVARGLAHNDARILLMPTDDDFDGNANFPPFHASDGVFRAAEHRVAFASGNTNGLSLITDPYGRIVAEGVVNEQGFITGETFIADGQTLYTRFGDWFGWLLVAGVVVLVGTAVLKKE